MAKVFFTAMPFLVASMLCYFGGISSIARAEEISTRKQMESYIEESEKMLMRLRRRGVNVTGTTEDVVAITLCVDSVCSSEHNDNARVISTDGHLVVTFLISYESGSSTLKSNGAALVEYTFSEILQGSGLFEEYEMLPVTKISVNGHADLEETAPGTDYDTGGLCATNSLASDSNECLSYLRANKIGTLFKKVLSALYGVNDPRMDKLSINFHPHPFLGQEAALFNNFLRKIGASSDLSQLTTLLGISVPQNSAGSNLRMLYSSLITDSNRTQSRGLMEKFRSVVVVIEFDEAMPL